MNVEAENESFIEEFLKTRNTKLGRQFFVRWKCKPFVPKKFSQEWVQETGIVMNETVQNMKRKFLESATNRIGDCGDDNGEGDEGEDDDCGDSEHDFLKTEEYDFLDIAVRSVFRWSTSKGRPLLSLRQCIQQQGHNSLKAMLEYTVCVCCVCATFALYDSTRLKSLLALSFALTNTHTHNVASLATCMRRFPKSVARTTQMMRIFALRCQCPLSFDADSSKSVASPDELKQAEGRLIYPTLYIFICLCH